ncbi:hypothetical protein [Mucilaginibacter ginsenosidivorans]
MFFYQLVCASDKVQAQEQIGNVIVILVKGDSAVHKRLIYLRKTQGNAVLYMQATATALRLGFLNELMQWYVDNRNWKDGGYFVPQEN